MTPSSAGGGSGEVVPGNQAAVARTCRVVAPELDSLAAERVGEIKVVKVNVDINQEVAGRYQIFSIPTIGLFRSGELVAASIGAKPKRLIEADLGISK